MKKIRIMIVCILLLILSSCDSKVDDMESFIKMPSVTNVSLKGSWKVTEKAALSADSQEEINKVNNIYIDKKLVEIGSKYNLEPSFESKYISSSSYFKGSDLKTDEIPKEEYVEVVTITGLPRFSFEIVKLSEDKIYFESEGFRYFLEKESDEVPKKILNKYEEERKSGKSLETYDGKIGISLVVKYQTKDDTEVVKSDYDSYYLYYDNTGYRNVGKRYFNENIYLPRSDQNDVLKYTESWDDNKYTGILTKLDKNDKSNTELEQVLYESDNPFEINYISESSYSISYNDKSTASRKIYNTFSLDSDNKDPLNVEDIDSKNGRKIIEDNIIKAKEKDVINKDENFPLDNYTNIGLDRVDGLWKFKTSIVLGEKGESIKDISFDLTPNKDFIRNNTLGDYKWADIKKIFGNAEIIDAYTSPENNFILVNYGETISLYSFTNLLKPIISLPKKEGTVSIVMANWIVGNDSDLYKEEFSKEKVY